MQSLSCTSHNTLYHSCPEAGAFSWLTKGQDMCNVPWATLTRLYMQFREAVLSRSDKYHECNIITLDHLAAEQGVDA